MPYNFEILAETLWKRSQGCKEVNPFEISKFHREMREISSLEYRRVVLHKNDEFR